MWMNKKKKKVFIGFDQLALHTVKNTAEPFNFQ